MWNTSCETGRWRREAQQLLEPVGLWDAARRDRGLAGLRTAAATREIALSLASAPELLLLDEPSSGLTTTESADITERIRALGEKITVLMVAHDMDLVFGVAERVILLHYGKIAAEGTCDEIRASQMVKDIYMGSHKAPPADA